MTKTVRIENADPSNHPVRVTGQTLQADGTWKDEASSTQLDFPTAMAQQTIYRERRIVIEERPADPPRPPATP